MNSEIALVVYDDHHHFRNMPFEEWTDMGGASLLGCGVVIEENEKWLKLVAHYNLEHRDKTVEPRNRLYIILKSAITYERRFRVRDCKDVDGMLTAFRHMKQEEELP